MGALATIIGSISDDVVSALASAGYPPLTPDASGNPGAILVGTAAMYEVTAPPRIIFEPLGFKLGIMGYASASADLDTLERRNQAALRTIRSKDVQFACRCWGAATTGVTVDDYDVTEALVDQVIASLQKLLPGAHATDETGKYPPGSNINRTGREVVFGVTIFRPILDALVPYALPNRTPTQIAQVVDLLFAPDAVVHEGTDSLVLPDGSGTTEPGCE